MNSFGQRLIQSAIDSGFPAAGAVDLLPLLEDSNSIFHQHVARYDEWLQNGFSGEMAYLVRGRDRRADPRLLFPEAKSVFSVLWPYRKRPAGVQADQGVRYARYLEGKDYHDEMKSKLEDFLSGFSDLKWKVCVDTSAVLERTWGALCGLGWIGKNSLLIHPKLGSYHFIGVAFLDQEVGAEPHLLPSYCGHCDRCLKACPTEALSEGGWLDSRKCISYLTLERRGQWDSFENRSAERMQNWVAGCDLCQEVCPFNTKSVKAELRDFALSESNETEEAGAIALFDWKGLLQETEEEYRKRIKNSALNRVKPAQFRRNLASALRRSIIRGEIPKTIVAELKPLISARLESENDEVALREWVELLKVMD